jgi:hypothetical protein
MVKEEGVPLHPFAEGVMVMVADNGSDVLLDAVNWGILPVPEAASPIPVLSLVQL